MKYIFILLSLLFFSCINFDKDPKWSVKTTVVLYENGNKCGSHLWYIEDAIVMSYEERTIYENAHNFTGWMKPDSGFVFLDLYYKDYWNIKNLRDTGTYLVTSDCRMILMHCTR